MSDPLSESVPDSLVPLRFQLARSHKVKPWLITVYLASIIVPILNLLFLHGLTVAGVLKAAGLVGDGLGAGVLVISRMVDRYSLKTYLETFTPRAREIPEYKGKSDVVLKMILEDFYGTLKSSTQNVLQTDVGALLVGISTFLALVGDLFNGL